MKFSECALRIGALLVFGLGCSASLGVNDDQGGGNNGGETGIPGTVPPTPRSNGLVFVSHFYEDAITGRNLLQWYRADKTSPEFLGEMDVGATTHSMALDKENELLAVISDTSRKVTLYNLNGTAAGEVPLVLSSIDFFDEIPLFADFDSDSNRLYVSASPTDVSGLTTNNSLYVYDTSNPNAPQPISGSPFNIPVTASWGVDPFRNVLWLVDFRENELLGYDLLENGIEEIPGGAIRLTELYPEENQASFQARDLTIDPWRNRIYAARSQGALSELIAIDYPSDVPDAGQRYGSLVSMTSLKKVEDAIDVSLPTDNRPTLLDGYEVALNESTGEVFVSGLSWNGRAASGAIVAYNRGLDGFAGGCEPTGGQGCWIETFTEVGSTFKQTDGAFCVGDMVAATSISSPETDPGFMHFFAKDENGQFEQVLNSQRENFRASSFPISAVCF